MLRQVSIFSFAMLAIATTSCTKSEDDLRKAQRETGGLMPAEEPKFEAEYVADQSQVRLVAARTISYEPLDTFRGKAKSEPAAEDSEGEERPEKPAAKSKSPARGAPSGGAPSGGGNFWSRVGMKALMGGGAPPPAKPPTKGGKPDAKGDKADEKKEPGDDEDADEEESEEEDSGDEESKEADSDGN